MKINYLRNLIIIIPIGFGSLLWSCCSKNNCNQPSSLLSFTVKANKDSKSYQENKINLFYLIKTPIDKPNQKLDSIFIPLNNSKLNDTILNFSYKAGDKPFLITAYDYLLVNRNLKYADTLKEFVTIQHPIYIQFVG